MIPAQPSHTAHRVALRRAAHQLLDRPLVLDDPLALPILGTKLASALRDDPRRFETGILAPYLRAFFVARSRFVEDQLAAARRNGVRQYVILGAGLDTFAYRVPAPVSSLRIWEVDHPASQAWKRERLAEAGITVPPEVTFVPLDFETQPLAEGLEVAGFAPSAGAIFSWLGVAPYLTPASIATTLRYVAGATATAGGVGFDYPISPDLLSRSQRVVHDALAERVRAAGVPWLSAFDPQDLMRTLRNLGFAAVEDVPPATINARYFANRSDGLKVGSLAHLMWAGANPPAR